MQAPARHSVFSRQYSAAIRDTLTGDVAREAITSSLAYSNLAVFVAVLFCFSGLDPVAGMLYTAGAFFVFVCTAVSGTAQIPKTESTVSPSSSIMVSAIANELSLASILLFDYFATERAGTLPAVVIIVSISFISVHLSAKLTSPMVLSKVVIVAACAVFVIVNPVDVLSVTEVIAALVVALLIMLATGYWIIIGRQKAILLQLQLQDMNRFADSQNSKLAAALAEKEATQKKLEQEYSLRQKLVSHVGHDLRQPITAASYMLMEISKARPSGLDSTLIADTTECMNSASRMIEDIVQYTHFNSLEIEVVSKWVCLNDVLLQVSREFSTLAERADIQIRCSYTSVQVFIDTDLLVRILRNLTINVIKHSDATQVLLGVRRKTSGLEIWVADNGCGIQEPEAEYALGSGQLAKGQSGLGLGISISRQLTQACGGTFGCSTKPGEGTVFKVCLPQTLVRR